MIAVPVAINLRPRAWWTAFWDYWTVRFNPTYFRSLERHKEWGARLQAWRDVLDRLDR